ncbi:MAG: hypothetical protein M0019_04355 [Actinomycetota bacterium]|nr:hypothetical protein [Actinomycetota bacterium]
MRSIRYFITLALMAGSLYSCGGGAPKFSNPGPLSTVKSASNGSTSSSASSSSAASSTAVSVSTAAQSSSTTASVGTFVAPPALSVTGSGTAELAMYQSDRSPYSFSQFRAVESNNTGNNGYDDATLDPNSLRVIDLGPFYQGYPTVAVDLSASPAAISFAWPSDRGYSNLICDLPGSGSYNLDALCIRSLLQEIDSMANSDSYILSPSQGRTFGQLTSDIDPQANSTVNQQQLNEAIDLYLDVANSIANVRVVSPSESQFQYSVTIDSLDNLASTLNAVKSVYPSRAMVRIVVDPGVSLTQYQSAIDLAHSMSIKVMIELMDSQYMKNYSFSNYQARIDQILGTLKDVDAWEIGNEVNGNWLGSNVAEKVAYAIDKASGTSTAPLFLTLYWQLGEDDAAHSIFNWVSENLNAGEISKLSSVGISLYPQEAPLGASFYRIMTTLHTVYFPSQSVYIGELGYGGSGVSGSWWWGSPAVTDASKAQTASTYVGLLLALPYPISAGPFWWYFVEEYQSSPQLLASLHSWYR